MNTLRTKCDATGKSRFATIGEAKASIVAIRSYNNSPRGKKRKKHKGKSELNRCYYCSHCHGYHLTSMEYKTRRKYKEEIRNKNQDTLILDIDQAASWKADSLPFPKTAEQ